MEYKSLRLGNYCQDREGRLCMVERLSVDPEDCRISAVHSALTSLPISPIPLNEEWLLNFGLKHVNTLHDGTKSFEGKPYCYFKDGELTISTATYHKIKYVHQFQNLIYALTGEELTIKK